MAFTYPFCYKPIPEIVRAAKELMRKIALEAELDGIFSEGKMLGVLMVREKDSAEDGGERSVGAGDEAAGVAHAASERTEGEDIKERSVGAGDEAVGVAHAASERTDDGEDGGEKRVRFLYGFSGLAGGRSVIEGFVPPIFDLNAPGSVYRAREAEISALSRRIRELDGRGDTDAAVQPRESRSEESITQLKAKRRAMSIELQDWLFGQYRVLNARGQWSSIREIFRRRGIMPPGGTGDCAAPKLLQYAYLHNLQPLALGEFWYGAPPLRELRLQGCFYPACTGKCGPLLEYMMQGLEVEPNPLERDDSEFTSQLVIYADADIVVANKPAGMLSVPGRTASNSLLTLLRRRFGEDLQSCHRLDMDTSGVMVFARGLRNKTLIEKQFAEHSAKKTYVARLMGLPERPLSLPKCRGSRMEDQNASTGLEACGHFDKLDDRKEELNDRNDKLIDSIPDSGRIELPLIADWDDRPRQMVDYEDGKTAVTEYVVIGRRPNGEIDVRFTPLTGRTHQLRVSAAHPSGLGRPIKGDRLYGAHPDVPASRLYLHAESLSFRHPATGEQLCFTTPAEFPQE